MTSIVDNLHEAAGNMPYRSGKPAGDAQRNAWLLQLEQAWMGNLGPNRSGVEPAGADAKPMPEVRSLFDAGMSVHAIISASMHADKTLSLDGSASFDEARVHESAATQHASTDAPHSDVQVQETNDAKSAAAYAGNAEPAQLATGGFATDDKGMSLFRAALPMGDAVHSQLVSLAGASASVEIAKTDNVFQIATVDPVKAGSTALRTAFCNTPQEPATDIVLGRAEQEDVPYAEYEAKQAAQETVSSQDQYAARNLHLYRNGNSVQAWLRDAALSDIGAYSVAQALQSELQRSALQLTALTVNGKRLQFSSIQEEEGRDGLRTSSQEPSTRYKTKVVQHTDQTAMNNGGATYGD